MEDDERNIEKRDYEKLEVCYACSLIPSRHKIIINKFCKPVTFAVMILSIVFSCVGGGLCGGRNRWKDECKAVMSNTENPFG